MRRITIGRICIVALIVGILFIDVLKPLKAFSDHLNRRPKPFVYTSEVE